MDKIYHRPRHQQSINYLFLLLLALSLWLTACGGGSATGTTATTPSATAPSPGTADDTTLPSISITSPSAGYTTTSSSVTLAGTASDNVGVTSISWSSDRGGSGMASGASNWSASIPLQSGANNIVVTARDAAGNIKTASLSVTSSQSLPPPPPPPIGSTIVGVDIKDQSGNTSGEVPMTFGQVFKPGDVPAGATLVARKVSTGEGVDLQVDKKTTHADGSLRHAVVTTRLRNFQPGSTESLQLVSTTAAPPSGSVTLSDLLAIPSFDAVVSLNVGGTVYQASARQLLQAGAAKTWLSGPLVTEWIVSAPAKTASDIEHPHLTARFNIRVYSSLNRVRVDVVVENDWAYVANPQNVTYDATITVGGTAVFNKSGLTHFHHARWRKVFWWGAEPKIYVAHDTAYLIATGAVPNYDRSIKMPSSALSNTASQWTGAITEPMGSGFLEQYMATAGSRAEIGPLPRWTAQYILSMDPAVKTAILGNGDVAGSWPIHYRDKTTDSPVSLVDHPNMTLLAAGHGFDDFPTCNNCSTPLTPDSAHQPSLAYVPYLVTGDYYYLEELQFWANWNMLQANPEYRNYASGLLKWDELRGQAWSLRTLGHAAYITPDANPMKKYFVDRANNNISWYVNEYPNNPAAPALGFLTSGAAIRNNSVMSPWEDDFFTGITGYLVDLGFSNAVPLRNWKTKFVVGRFGNDPVFCKYQGATYTYIVVDQSNGQYIGDWAKLKQVNFPGSCPSNYIDYLFATDGYLAHARVALATAVAAGYTNATSYIADIKQAQQASNPPADYASDPTWMIIPR